VERVAELVAWDLTRVWRMKDESASCDDELSVRVGAKASGVMLGINGS
jgi:hypothetical protein